MFCLIRKIKADSLSRSTLQWLLWVSVYRRLKLKESSETGRGREMERLEETYLFFFFIPGEPSSSLPAVNRSVCVFDSIMISHNFILPLKLSGKLNPLRMEL